MANINQMFVKIPSAKCSSFLETYVFGKKYDVTPENSIATGSVEAVLYTYEEYKGLEGKSGVTEEQFDALPVTEKTKTASYTKYRITAYDEKICFIESTQEIFTQGKIYGINNQEEIESMIGTIPSEYSDVISYIDAKSSAASEGKLSENVLIAGGPLSNDVLETADSWPTGWYDENNNKIIPKDKSLKEILEGLFLKVINGTISIEYTTWNPSIAAPTIAIKQGSNSVANTEKEVGSKATVTYSAGTTVSGNSITAKLTATQGYFIGTGTTWNAKANNTVIETVNGTTTGTATVNTATIKVGSAAATDIATGTEITVGEGDNTVSVSQNGVTAKCTGDFANTTYYASTNTKSKLSTSATVTDKTLTDKTLTNSSSATVTGVRYMFWGSVTQGDGTTSASIRSVSNGSGKTASRKNAKVDVSIFTTAGATQLLIAAPKGTREISQVFNVAASNAECSASFVKQPNSISVEGANEFTGADYDVWLYTAGTAFDAGKEFKVIFNK